MICNFRIRIFFFGCAIQLVVARPIKAIRRYNGLLIILILYRYEPKVNKDWRKH
jgi:hypothetical protein